jgi:S1-C subfamily serine protease
VRRVEKRAADTPEIAEGEVVVACNGQSVRTVHDLVEALKNVPTGEKVRLEILEPSGDRRIVTVAPAKE